MFPWNTRLGQLFDNMWHTAAHEGLAPGAELEETDDGFTLEMDLPGVAKDDITIDVLGRRMAVRGTRKEKERSGAMRHSTRVTGSFAYEVMCQPMWMRRPQPRGSVTACSRSSCRRRAAQRPTECPSASQMSGMRLDVRCMADLDAGPPDWRCHLYVGHCGAHAMLLATASGWVLRG
jgi:hypothetical protein